jgi:hypothetical protein
MPIGPSDPEPPNHKRRWLQFSLRTLPIFTLICAIASTWVARRMKQRREEREVVEAILKHGAGRVYYDYQLIQGGEPSGPAWLRRFVGEDFFNEIKVLSLNRLNGFDDTELARLNIFTGLQDLDLEETAVTDARLVNLIFRYVK